MHIMAKDGAEVNQPGETARAIVDTVRTAEKKIWLF